MPRIKKYFASKPPCTEDGWKHIRDYQWRSQNWELWFRSQSGGYQSLRLFSPDGARAKASYTFGWFAKEERLARSHDLKAMEEIDFDFAIRFQDSLAYLVADGRLPGTEVASK